MDNQNKVLSFDHIIDQEKNLLLTAENKYKQYFKNALDFVSLSQNFVIEVEPNGWIFALFLSQIKKHLVLAFFSAIRRHHIQAMMDLRQVFEAGLRAAYAMAFPNQDIFIKIDGNGISYEPEGLTKKCSDWLGQNYPEASKSMYLLKNNINSLCSHSNAIYAFANFSLEEQKIKFEFDYFDKDDEDLIKGDLFFVGNVAKGLMDLFNGVNKKQNIITLSSDFAEKLLGFEATENKLRQEMLDKPRFARYSSLLKRNSEIKGGVS